jgi:hypothetical protein
LLAVSGGFDVSAWTLSALAMTRLDDDSPAMRGF